jgi:hypothetical protein
MVCGIGVHYSIMNGWFLENIINFSTVHFPAEETLKVSFANYIMVAGNFCEFWFWFAGKTFRV